MATETAARRLRKWCKEKTGAHLTTTNRPLAIARQERAQRLREAMCVFGEALLELEPFSVERGCVNVDHIRSLLAELQKEGK